MNREEDVPEALAKLLRKKRVTELQWRKALRNRILQSPAAQEYVTRAHRLDFAPLGVELKNVRFVLMLHADNFPQGLTCPTNAFLVRCAKDALEPVPVDWRDTSRSVAEVALSDGQQLSVRIARKKFNRKTKEK